MKNIIHFRSDIFHIWIIIILIISNFAFSTGGGPEIIKILGYSHQERKVFFATYFFDATSGLPEISYIEFSSGTPSKPVVDQSWHGENEKVTRLLVNKHLNSLRSQLQQLHEDKSDSLTIIIKIIESGNFIVADDLPPRKYYKLEVQIKSDNMKGVTNVTAYANKHVGVKRWYYIPNEKYALAIFYYTGIPIEQTYTKDTIVILNP